MRITDTNTDVSFWDFRFLPTNCGPAIKRYILRLKFSNLFMKFQVFLLECSNKNWISESADLIGDDLHLKAAIRQRIKEGI